MEVRMKCLKCKKTHDGKFGSGKYCSRTCANSRTWTKEAIAKKKVSAKLSWKRYSPEDRAKRTQKARLGATLSATKYRMETSFELLGFTSQKRRVLEEQNQSCLLCGITEWQGKPIAFELDHIDGNKINNTRSNVRILCPNCHSQTPTWKGRNIKPT